MDDGIWGAIVAVVVALALLGLVLLVEAFAVTKLNNSAWNCTEVVIDNGKPACIKYERVKK